MRLSTDVMWDTMEKAKKTLIRPKKFSSSADLRWHLYLNILKELEPAAR